MVRNALLAFAFVCGACASDAADPLEVASGSGDAAGSGALADAGGSPAVGVAGRAVVEAAGTGEPADAGTAVDAGTVATAGAGGSVAGVGAGGAAGTVEVAGSGAAGSSGQAGAASTPTPIVHELWTIMQSNASEGGTAVNTVDAPVNITARLQPSGSGSLPATSLLWTFTRGEPVDHTFTMISGAGTVETAYLACGTFRSDWESDGGAQYGGADVVGPVTTVTPAHVTYVRLVASSKLTGSVEAWQLAVSITWTAYGY